MPVSTAPATARTPPRRVLEDSSGRRLRRMRWVGRVVALLFLVWLAIVILGGLGVAPAGWLPFSHVLRASAGPPPIRHLPPPAAPAASDLVPALPAPAAAATAIARPVAPGRSATAPGRARKAATAITRGRSAAAPGHTATTVHGRSTAAPGHTTTTVRGKAAAAPGKLKHTTTTTTSTTTTTTTTTAPGKAHLRGKKP